MSRLALLGGGKMGEALLGGLIDAGWDPEDLAVADPVPERRHVLEGRFPKVRVVPAPAWAVAEAEVVVVAVKPTDVPAALESAASALVPGTLVVSIAAGVTLATLEALVPGYPVIRAMPNTPALVRRGAAAIAAGTHAGEEHMTRAERILAAVGTVTRVPESLLDAVTGLSGSGPAYVFLLAEALVDAGVGVGLPRPVARALVIQTLLGSATLLAEGPEGPEALRAAVTSPGGTTAAGLAALEARAMRSAIFEAVTAATERSRELGQQEPK
ncbi:MAG: pyrroline-5-carboxylate reductase [Acidimicrobiia bacterium]